MTAVAAASLACAAALGAVTVAGAAGGDDPVAAFRLADGSAGCALLRGGGVACRGAGTDRALALTPAGAARATTQPVAWNAATPVLLPGESWWEGGTSCTSTREALTCTAGRGSITLARGGAGAASSVVLGG